MSLKKNSARNPRLRAAYNRRPNKDPAGLPAALAGDTFYAYPFRRDAFRH